ncbi:MAG TPA: multicopper oxidase domain-containing protein, partial [Candidatus Thermoplasmatota archaeon]|nr:multicopper oxidase domain-containing protein [Candidatus Thermoplasmatota archaeon]
VRPQRDWYPVTYAPYTADYNTFLINGVAFPYTEPLVGKEGDVMRIRMINAGNSLFAMHLHGHHVLVTHKDGIALESPYWADTVLLAPGERYDVFVRLDNPGLWDFHDHIGGHTQNDNIFPGGAMTMLCYEGYGSCPAGGHGGHGGHKGHSGSLLRWSGREML